jgi:lysyl-tRNA synthetase class I
MSDFDFSFKRPEMGKLDPEQLRFFYYDVVFRGRESLAAFFDWNDEVEDFLKSRGIEVTAEKKKLTDESKENVVCFIKGNKESKPEAFFRHMRNAFAHYKIVNDREYIVMKDYFENKKNKKKSLTMSAMIKYDDLKELCSIFFRQADDTMQAIDDANRPEV